MNANKNANKATHPDNQLLISGHNGQRVGRERAKREGRKPGTWAPELDEHGQPINRRRWTTALRCEALDHLQQLSTQLGLRRCEVVEKLLMDPQCRQRLLQSDPPDAVNHDEQSASESDKPASDTNEVEKAIELACRAYGNEWPNDLSKQIAELGGTSPEVISRKKHSYLNKFIAARTLKSTKTSEGTTVLSSDPSPN